MPFIGTTSTLYRDKGALLNPQVGGCWGIKAPRILDIQWGIYARYESATGKVWSLNGLLEAVDSTIGVKQGCPLSSTLFGLYIDDVSHYIEKQGFGSMPSGYHYTNITIC